MATVRRTGHDGPGREPSIIASRRAAASRPSAAKSGRTDERRDGCRIRSTGETIPPEPTPGPVVDTTGAGDCFNGVLAVRLAEGEPLRDACRHANEAAAAEVAARYVLPAIPRRKGAPLSEHSQSSEP